MRLLQFIVFAILLFGTSPIFAQDFLEDNEYHFGLTNRLEAMLVQEDTTEFVSGSLSFNTGVFLEDEKYDGFPLLIKELISNKIKAALKTASNQRPNPIRFESKINHEYILFYWRIHKDDLPFFLSIIRDVFKGLSFKYDDISKALKTLSAEADSTNNISFNILNNAVTKLTWEQVHDRRILTTVPSDSLVGRAVNEFIPYYICPKNALLIVRGNLDSRGFLRVLKDKLGNWAPCEFSPFIRYPIPKFRKLLSSKQILVEDSTANRPVYIVAHQGASTFSGGRNIGPEALVFRHLLSSPQSSLYHQFRDSCGIASLEFNYEWRNYFSQLTFVIYPDTAHIAGSFMEFIDTRNRLVNDTLLTESDLAIAKESAIEFLQLSRKSPYHQLEELTGFWASAKINDYSVLEESINAVTLDELKQFLKKYIVDNPFVAGLSIKPSARKKWSDPYEFNNVSGDIRDYQLSFKENTAMFTNKKQDSIFSSLAQYLHINPEEKIKVNGVAHKDELLQVSDKEMLEFVKSLDHFILNPPSLMSKKRFRLDVYRSLTIMRKLIQEGISLDRLFGTGFRDRTPPENRVEAQIVYCSPFK